MPRIITPKTITELRRLTEPGLYAVGGVSGLHLQVTATGARSWILRATVGSKRRDFGLGGCADVPLKDARERAREYRAQIRGGIDPAEQREAARQELIAEQAKDVTFAQAARMAHESKKAGFRNIKHRADWISSIQRYAIPAIGNKRVADITTADIEAVLLPIWVSKAPTARKLLQRLQLVFDWATVRGLRDGENPAKWDGNLSVLMSTQPRQKGHHKALPWESVPAFLGALQKRNGVAPVALRFAILTGARSGEARGMTWAEVDMRKRLWTIPAERMKAHKAHTVPLSSEAMAILHQMPREDDGLVFKAPRGGMLSDMAMSQVCRRMRVPAVPHGFRASFKDWARSNSTLADEISELCLAHVDSNATRAAYARGGLLDKRRELLEAWAQFCAPAPASNVTPIRKASA